jgi:hypothetical protein
LELPFSAIADTELIENICEITSDRDALLKVLHGDLQKDGPTPLWGTRSTERSTSSCSRRVAPSSSR